MAAVAETHGFGQLTWDSTGGRGSVDRGRADSNHTWIGKVDLKASVARMVHRLVLTVGGTGIGGLGDPFLGRGSLP